MTLILQYYQLNLENPQLQIENMFPFLKLDFIEEFINSLTNEIKRKNRSCAAGDRLECAPIR